MSARPLVTPRFCYNCGAAIVPGRRTCLRCNTAFEKPTVDASSAPRDAVPPGTRLCGRFELESVASTSRLHIVYRSWDHLLERAVSLRLLRDSNQKRRAELKRQARLQNALEHPYIVPTLDFIEDRELGVVAIVERYLGNRTLRDWLKSAEEPGLPYIVYRQLMLPVVSAMAYAHRHGVVHRNLKPKKILLDMLERPCVSDFGMLAYAPDPVPSQQGFPLVMGTLEYSAPEQVEDPMSADAATDIYSLGVIFYEIVSGALPITSDHDLGLMQEILQTPPTPLLSHVPDVLPGLDGVIMRCLEKDPAERYQTADALYIELADVLGAPIYAKS